MTYEGRSSHGSAGPEAWSVFWREFSAENEPNERCHIPADGRHLVDRHWADFVQDLPPGAHVIDLGCGAGIVGRKLLSRRRDLQVASVDWTRVPTSGPANLTIHAGVSMEALPFGECSFDAAVSLFGIEYGDIVKTARELERVLKPGARFSFLAHHRESEIVREGDARRKALRELTSGPMKSAFLSGSAAGVDQQRQGLKTRFPNEPMVRLISDHFRRNIARTRAQRQEIWQRLADELDPKSPCFATSSGARSRWRRWPRGSPPFCRA